jgi:hypothetical protein
LGFKKELETSHQDAIGSLNTLLIKSYKMIKALGLKLRLLVPMRMKPEKPLYSATWFKSNNPNRS